PHSRTPSSCQPATVCPSGESVKAVAPVQPPSSCWTAFPVAASKKPTVAPQTAVRTRPSCPNQRCIFGHIEPSTLGSSLKRANRSRVGPSASIFPCHTFCPVLVSQTQTLPSQ